jgi:hypothetical protein
MAQISTSKSCQIPPWEMPPNIQHREVLGCFSKAIAGRDVPHLRSIEILSKRIGQGDAKGSAE